MFGKLAFLGSKYAIPILPPRYNAQVLEVLGHRSYRLLYTDYGNEEVVKIERIVTSPTSLGGQLVDPGVHQQWVIQAPMEEVEDDKVGMGLGKSSKEERVDCEPTFENIEAMARRGSLICEGESCLAIWGEDGVLYRATLKTWLPSGLMAEVHFIDYDNKDLVDKENLFRDFSCVPEELRHGDLVDINIVRSPSFSGNLSTAARHAWAVKVPSGRLQGLVGPSLHLVIMDDGKVVAALRSQERVLTFSAGGKPLADLQPWRKFKGLRSVAKVGKDRVAVLDSNGVQLFDGPDLVCVRDLEMSGLGITGGTCLGEGDELVIVNRGAGGVRKQLTSEGEVDLLYVSLDTGKLRKRLEMVDILGDGSNMSACNHIAYQVRSLQVYHLFCILHQDNRLHVVDSGLTQLYTLYDEDDEPQAMLCGSRDQWEQPTGIAVDADGTLLVADSGTSRLLTVSSKWIFTGQLVADPQCPFNNPEAVALNPLTREMVVYNEGSKEIAKYILSK